MALTTQSLLPEGMRERTFALKSHPSGNTIKFGRATQFPASEYIFPSIEAMTESYRRLNSHSTSFGATSLTPDFFEATVGALEPGAADKLQQLAYSWNMPNFSRTVGERHELYYVLGGRARMMYGKPSRIGFTHHGYKTSYHEAILRFAVSDPLFYDANEITSYGIHTAVANGTNTYIENIPEGFRPQVPSVASVMLSGTAKKVLITDGTRTMLEVDNIAGVFTLNNFPGFSRTRYEPAGGTPNTGGDIISPNTPPFKDFAVSPGQSQFRIQVVAGTTTSSVGVTIKWRNAYASP